MDFPARLKDTLPKNQGLWRRDSELAALQAALRQAQNSWLPRVSTQAEISVSGEGFPLVSPGFSLGLSLDFSTPFIPFRTGISAGSDAIGERSLGMTSSADVGENLEGVQSVRIAGIDLQKAQAEMQSFKLRLEFSDSTFCICEVAFKGL